MNPQRRSSAGGQSTLPADVLDGRLVRAAEVANANSAARIARVSQLASRGDFADAAGDAAELLRAGVCDIRLIGFYLFGVFLERGAAYLPQLLRRVRVVLSDEYAALLPERRKALVVDSAVTWLLHNLTQRILFHTQSRDAVWENWVEAGGADLDAAIAGELEQLVAAAVDRVAGSRTATPAARLRRWTREDLRRALRRAPPTDDDDDDPEVAAEEPLPAPEPPAVEHAPEPVPPIADAETSAAAGLAISPALASLQRKLDAFRTLVERGDFPRAAVVASDVRGVLENFDPLAYLPSLFTGYLRALHQFIDELMPYWDAAGSPAWHALDQLYRVDLDAFLDE